MEKEKPQAVCGALGSNTGNSPSPANKPSRAFTIEDPPEYRVGRVVQGPIAQPVSAVPTVGIEQALSDLQESQRRVQEFGEMFKKIYRGSLRNPRKAVETDVS